MIKFLEKIFGGFVGAFEFPKPEVQYTPRDALLTALNEIQEDENYFVCLSLEDIINSSTKSLRDSSIVALNRIHCLIGANCEDYSVIQWLKDNHKDFYDSHIKSGLITRKQYRIEWIKHLLENDPVFAESI